MIPSQLQRPEFRFCLLKPRSKVPFEVAWQQNGYRYDDKTLQAHIAAGGNYGCIGGYGRLRIIDLDTKNPDFRTTVKEFQQLDTFTIRTGSGGYHYYILSDYGTNHVFAKGAGEFRALNYQVVGPDCTHPNGRKYSIQLFAGIKDVPERELMKFIGPLLRTETPATTSTEGNEDKDTSHSGREFAEVCRLIRQGKTKQEIFIAMQAFAKWTQAPEQYRQTTYKKALQKVTSPKVTTINSIRNEEKISEENFTLLKNPRLLQKINEHFNKKIEGEHKTRITTFITLCGVWVSNAQPASFNLMVNSTSGAGKSYVTKRVLEIFPQHLWEYRTRISPTAFNYWHNAKFEPEWDWNGKICYLEDVSDSILNHPCFKVMCSEGSKTTITINNRAIDIEIKGKPVLIITAAEASPKSEMLRRLPINNLDETEDQTKAILKRQAKNALKIANTDYDPSITKAFTALKRINVTIPYAERIAEEFPTKNLIARTHFHRFLDLIKACAALHQQQRTWLSENTIEANGTDYEIARLCLLQTTKNSQLIPLTHKQRKVLEVCKEQNLEWFSVPDLAKKNPWLSGSKWYDYMDSLAEMGFFLTDSQQREGSKKPVRVFKLKEEPELSLPNYQKVVNVGGVVNDIIEGIVGFVPVCDWINSLNSLNSPKTRATLWDKAVQWFGKCHVEGCEERDACRVWKDREGYCAAHWPEADGNA